MNKCKENNLNMNKMLENMDEKLKSLIKDCKDNTAKLREYCNDTFTFFLTTESNQAELRRQREDTNVIIDRYREELVEIIKNNKTLADSKIDVSYSNLI
jgi:predicted mannosyl-3-phosphoglycerate phosphatase (HAD superfamily)